jgi:hypothetical protein
MDCGAPGGHLFFTIIDNNNINTIRGVFLGAFAKI